MSLSNSGAFCNECVFAAEEIPSAQSLASDVADATGGTLKELKSGYSVTVPQGSRGVVVRVMEECGTSLQDILRIIGGIGQ